MFLLAVVIIILGGGARGEDVTKTLYLHDDGSGTEDDNTDIMSTTHPTQNVVDTPGGQEDYDGEGSPGLTIMGSFVPANKKTYHYWELTPAFAKTFHIHGDVNVNLYVDNNGKSGQEEIHVELFYTNGTNEQHIASTDRTFNCDSISASSQPVTGFQRVDVLFSSIDATIPTGHYLVLNVTAVNPPSNKLWFAYDTIEHPSHINITTDTFVSVDEIKTYSTTLETSTFLLSEWINITANVSDPLGSYDLSGANITVYYPDDSILVSNTAMTLNKTDLSTPSAWKLFNFTIDGSLTSRGGRYRINVFGIESNGVTENMTITFDVISSNPLHHISLTPMYVNPASNLINVSGKLAGYTAMGWNDAVQIERNLTWTLTWDTTDILGMPGNFGGNAATGYTADYQAGVVIGFDNITVSDITGSVTNKSSIQILPGAPYQIVIISGNGQSSAVGTGLPAPFVVEVRDQYGNPVGAGEKVWFNITTTGLNGDGSLSTMNLVLTNESGRAETTLTLDTKPGTNTVTAEIGGGGTTQITFTATVVSDIIEQTIWDMIYWPWSLFPLILVGVLTFVLLAKRKRAIIDEVFLVYRNGNLLAHATRRLKPDYDEDILVAMLTAIQEFVKYSFMDERKWALHRLSFGEQEIVIERGEKVFLALVHSGVNVKAIIPKMRKIVEEIEKEYKEVLEDWDGDLNELRGVKDKIEAIFK